MTLGELHRTVVDTLTPTLGLSEAKATARLLFEDTLGLSATDILLRGDRPVEPETEARFRKFAERIAGGEPPQYVVGRARFMGMDIEVTPDTLIPRPETTELVDLVVDYAHGRPDLKILDVGTGSGCIAIALARAIAFSRVTAIDISEKALEVARLNASALHARIEFEKFDILSGHFDGEYDIVVSNPPYIAESERGTMEPRVKDHEPSAALFVPDDDPLKFYRAIVENCRSKAWFFEINPLFADELAKMLAAHGLDCELRLDSFGKKRFAVAFSH